MTDNTPDWANTGNSNAPAWANPQAGAPTWANSDPYEHLRQQYPGHDDEWYRGAKEGGVIPEPDSGGIGGILSRLGKTIQGDYMAAANSGFGGLIARKIDEATGYAGTPYSTEKINEANQGYNQDPKITKQIQQAYERANVQRQRQKYANEVEQNSQGFNPAGFAAGAVGSADPSYLINPAEGVVKNLAVKGAAKVAAKVAVNTGAHAVLGSADDAAYQVADDIDGIKKGFDIKRNLESAAMMGTFGAAHPIVSDFVVGLYKDRGIDTTPVDKPTGSNTPLTTDKASLSPEDTAQYHELLKSGTEQDIKGFFADKQGPKPSWDQVHQWVNYRDNVPEGYAQEEYHPQFDYAAETTKQNVQDHIAQQTKDWKNAPDVNVVHSDEALASNNPELAKAAQDPATLGAYDSKTGQVHIFADRVDSPETLNSLLYHEALGHYGLAQKFGDSLDKTLQTLMDRNVGKFNDRVDDWQKSNPGAYNGDRVRAAEEVLAEDSQKGQIKPSVGDAISAQVRRYGRRMGLDLSYSDGEINTILGMAHDAVVNGKGRDVIGNGFRFSSKPPGEEELPGQNTSDVISSALNRSKSKDFTDLAQSQRDAPETAMLKAQRDVSKYPSGNTYGTLLEHVGDLTHRMSEPYAQQSADHGLEYVAPKVSRAIDALENQVDRERLDTSKPWNEPSVQEYVKAHSKLPVYNTVQRLARDSAIKLGQGDIDGSLYNLKSLKNIIDSGRFPEEATKYEPSNNRFMKRSQLAASTDYTVKSLQETYDSLDKDYEPTTRNWDETRRAALEAGFKPSQIKDLADIKDLDKRMYRLGAAAHMLDMRIDELNQRLGTPDWSMQDKADYIQAVSDYHYMLNRIRDNRSEIGRALNISKAIGYTRAQMENINEMLTREGGTLSPLADDETFLKFAKMIKNLKDNGNPEGAEAAIRSLSKPYWWQYLLSFRQNMMLSGLSTHLKSTMDMATNGFRDFEEGVAALPGGLVRNVINGLGGKVKPGVHPTELAGGVWGVAKAALEAQTYKDTLTALREGFQNQQDNGTMIPMPDMPGILGLPSKMVAAQDTFFRSFLHNANLYNLGTRKAYAELKGASNSGKVSWDDVMSLGSSYARDPSPEMLEQAKEMANQTILMNKSPINALIGQAKAIRPEMSKTRQAGSFIANLLTTFTRIQSNAFMNQVVRRSPLFFLDKVSRDDLAAGGARADIAITRAIMGTALMGTYWVNSDPKKDELTGEGPATASKRAAMEASGWRPNAVHENGQYQTGNTLNLSINPFDKHNNISVMIAGLRRAYETGKDAKDIATGLKLAGYSIVHDFTSSTFVAQLEPAVDAFTSRSDTMGQKAQKFLGNEARTFLPNITNQAAKIIDPNQHDTGGTVLGSVEQNIPGLTHNLPIKYSVYGEPLKTGTTITGLHSWIGPGNHQEEATDPTIKELGRLEKSVTGTLVSPTQKTIRVMDVPLKLTTQQAEEYQMYAGKTIVQAVHDQMAAKSWSKMSDQDKVDYVRSIEKDAKSQVKDALLQKEGWLNQDQLSSLRKQLNGQ